MKHSIIIFFLLLTTSVVTEAGQFNFLAGGDIATFNIDEALDKSNGLYSLGVEYHHTDSSSYGLTFSFSNLESDYDTDRMIKADCYFKYNFRPDNTFTPFIAAGLSATGIRYQACVLQSGNDGSGIYVHNGCDSYSVRSVGGIYQVGVGFNFGRRNRLEGFWSQFLGSNNLVVNIIGLRCSF